ASCPPFYRLLRAPSKYHYRALLLRIADLNRLRYHRAHGRAVQCLLIDHGDNFIPCPRVLVKPTGARIHATIHSLRSRTLYVRMLVCVPSVRFSYRSSNPRLRLMGTPRSTGVNVPPASWLGRTSVPSWIDVPSMTIELLYGASTRASRVIFV